MDKAARPNFSHTRHKTWFEKYVKKAPINTAAEHIKNVQALPTKQAQEVCGAAHSSWTIKTSYCRVRGRGVEQRPLKSQAAYRPNLHEEHLTGPYCQRWLILWISQLPQLFQVFLHWRSVRCTKRCAMLAFSNLWNLFNMIQSYDEKVRASSLTRQQV